MSPPTMERYQPRGIDLTPEHASQLQKLVHPYFDLQKKGYVLSQLTREDLDRKRRCAQCNRVLSAAILKRLSRISKGKVVAAKGVELDRGPEVVTGSELPAVPLASQSSLIKLPASSEVKDAADQGHQQQNKAPKNPEHCSFHPGRVGHDRRWSCCGGNPMSRPCHQTENHVPIVYSNGELEANWRFEHTPPRRPGSAPSLVAVAVDCEMGTADSGESELIRISMVDYFTGVTLIDKLVWPDVRMAHFNTRFSGVTRQAMNQARRNRTCLFGRHGARRAIWSHVGPETVVIGHALNSDLTSLRWIHTRVIDTLMVEDPFARAERERLQTAHAEAIMAATENDEPVPAVPESQHPGCSLKALTKAYLKRDIQLRGRGHDSLEDATATRDLLHWHVKNRMPAPKATATAST